MHLTLGVVGPSPSSPWAKVGGERVGVPLHSDPQHSLGGLNAILTELEAKPRPLVLRRGTDASVAF